MEPAHKKTMTDIRKKTVPSSSTVFSTTSDIVVHHNHEHSSRSGQRNQNPPTKTTPSSRTHILGKASISEKDLSSVLYTPQKIFFKFTKRAILVAMVGLIGWIASSLWYHGQVYITIKKQVGKIDENFTAVPKELFTGSEKTLPYYTYTDEPSEAQFDNIPSQALLDSLYSKLPPDAVTDASFVFTIPIKDTQKIQNGIIFFKKSDIEIYLNTFVLDKTYKNILQDVSQVQIATITPINYQLIQSNFSIHLVSDFKASGNINTKTINLKVVELDRFTCKEILQSIPEITVDKCRIIPFWYHKMPKNPLFIKIKDKNL